MRTSLSTPVDVFDVFCRAASQILAMVDGLMVHQEVETLEAIANAIGIGYEGNNQ